jgi:DNA invertase Pin-like site-specific DNA recombinase
MKTKAILYVRVSTDEQADKGYSLQHQEERLRNYCSLQGIEVVAFFREDHSAKTFERPQFNSLLEFIKKNKRVADLLLFLKWDRFSRNAGDAYFMINSLNKLGVEPQAIEQPLDLTIPENKIMLAFYLAAPEVENDRRSLNTIAGMRRAKKEGRWIAKAPIGYKMIRNERNQPIVVQDPATAPIMRWVFEEIANAVYSAEMVYKKAKEKGLQTHKSSYFEQIKNPFYCGRIFIPAYKDEEAQYVNGIHEPLISEQLFNEVQDIMNGKKRNFPTRQTAKVELPLRGFLICSKCGGNLTGSKSKGRDNYYFYYHCNQVCGERIKAPEANAIIAGEIKKIAAFHSPYTALFESEALALFGNGNQESQQSKEKAKVDLAKHKERLNNAQQLLLDGGLDAADYKEIKARYEPMIRNLEAQLEVASEANAELEHYLKFGTYFFKNLDRLYFEGDLAVKQQIIGSIFPEKIIFENYKPRTTRVNSVVSLICRPVGASSDSKNRKIRKNADLSVKAPPARLERATL